MAFPIRIRIEKTYENEVILGSLGLLGLRWDDTDQAWTASATGKSWTAMGQQSDVVPRESVEVLGDHSDHRQQASEETLRKFARAAAVADGNAFFGAACEPPDDMESQYLPEARHAAMVLEGLGVDPDAFAALHPDSGSAFTLRVRRMRQD